MGQDELQSIMYKYEKEENYILPQLMLYLHF